MHIYSIFEPHESMSFLSSYLSLTYGQRHCYLCFLVLKRGFDLKPKAEADVSASCTKLSGKYDLTDSLEIRRLNQLLKTTPTLWDSSMNSVEVRSIGGDVRLLLRIFLSVTCG